MERNLPHFTFDASRRGRGDPTGFASVTHASGEVAGQVVAVSPDGLLWGRLEQPVERSRLSRLSPPELRIEVSRQGEVIERLSLEARLLRRAHAAQRCAMAIAGHDLRQPLQVIAGVLSRCERQADRDASAWISRALQEVQTLAGGLERLAIASGVGDAGLEEIATASFPISRLMGGLETAWRHAAAAKGLTFDVITSETSVLSSPNLLRAVLDNLVGNAIKYTSVGGVRVTAREVENAVWIQVLDTGPGMKPDEIQRFFEPFLQGDAASEGLGLGLAIVREIADLLGHDIDVLSVPDGGSCFSVRVALG